MFSSVKKLSGFLAIILVAFSLTSVPFEASAAPQDQTGEELAITKVICNAIEQLTGPIGRAIAVLIIISLAIALFLGKVTWGLAIAVAVGLGILFGAQNVVGLLTGEDAETICPRNIPSN